MAERFPGVVGGGDFRGLNLEGDGWDGLRIKTPEVCAVYGQEGLVSVAILQGVQTIGSDAFLGAVVWPRWPFRMRCRPSESCILWVQ